MNIDGRAVNIIEGCDLTKPLIIFICGIYYLKPMRNTVYGQKLQNDPRLRVIIQEHAVLHAF